MYQICTDITNWIVSHVLQPVTNYVNQLQQYCQDQPCDWWMLCLNKLICWMVWALVAVVSYALVAVLISVTTLVCYVLVTAVALLLLAIAMVLLGPLLAALLVILAVLLPIYLSLRASLIFQALINWWFEMRGICEADWLTTVKRIEPLSDVDWSPELRRFRNAGAMGPQWRPILCCDGGGVRGILTLQVLKWLETSLHANCIDIFDMFAGTSTGSIIVACLASGVPLDDVIALYRAKYKYMFTYSLIYAIVGGIPGLNQLFVPKYDNSPNKCLLKSIFGDETLADSKKDLLITAKDTVRSETTYLTAFHNPNAASDIRGTYRTVKTWAAVAASAASAPTFFKSVGRYIDGGVGSYNNTAYVAAVEALRYSGTALITGYVDANGNPGTPYPVYGPGPDVLYQKQQVIVLSFGTGTSLNSMKVGQAPNITTSVGWIEWLLDEGMEDANHQQTYVAKNELASEENAIEFRRYQLNFTDATISELRATDTSFTLPAPSDLTTIGLDAVVDFAFLDQLGHAYGLWLANNKLFYPPPISPPMDIEIGDPRVTMQPTYNISVYGPEVIKELNNWPVP
jgi:predicted acylesterase/phospholipase RssA